MLEKRRILPDEANRLRALISGTTELVDFADCDFVIEAVFEEMSIKKQVFANLEKHVSESCVRGYQHLVAVRDGDGSRS